MMVPLILQWSSQKWKKWEKFSVLLGRLRGNNWNKTIPYTLSLSRGNINIDRAVTTTNTAECFQILINSKYSIQRLTAAAQ